MYLNMCLSLVAGLLVEALVGGALQDKIPHQGWEKSVYSLNPFPVVCVYCAVVKPDQPASFLWCHEKSWNMYRRSSCCSMLNHFASILF